MELLSWLSSHKQENLISSEMHYIKHLVKQCQMELYSILMSQKTKLFSSQSELHNIKHLVNVTWNLSLSFDITYKRII